MADELNDRLIAAATAEFQKLCTDGVAKQSVELFELKRNGCIELNCSGRGFEWRHRFQRGSPVGFGGTETLNYDARNDFVVASLSYRGFADGVALTWKEKQEAKGTPRVLDLPAELLDNLESDAVDALCTDFYLSGTTRSSKTIQGLAASIGTGLTYAGLSTSTYTSWASQYVSGAGYGSDPFAELLSLKVACQTGAKGGKTRNRIGTFLCASDDYQTAVNFAQAQQWFGARDEEMLKAGFGDNMMVHGVPLVWSEYATDNSIYGVNWKEIKLRCTTPDIFEFHTEVIQGAPRTTVMYFLTHMNLQNRNPRASGVLHSTNT